MKIFSVARKELKHIIRDPRTLFITFFIPLIQLFLFGYALSLDVRNLNLVVADLSKTTESRHLVEKYTSSGYFKLVDSVGFNEVDYYLDSGKADIAILIPRNFTKQVSERNKVEIIIDGSDPVVARSAKGYSRAIYNNYINELNRNKLNQNIAFKPIINVLYNSQLKSSYFIVPGIIALLLMVITSIDVAIGLIREKELMTWEKVMMSPLKSHQLILGKLLPYFGIAVINASSIIIAGMLLFGVPLRGSILLLIISCLIFLFSTMSIGILVASFAGTLQTGTLVAFMVTMLPAVFLSGFVFPIRSMPSILQLFSALVPAKYFLVILRGIFLKGVGAGVLLPQILILVIFGTVLTVAAVLSMRRILK